MRIPEFYEKYAEKIRNELLGLIVTIPSLLIALTKIEIAGGEAYLVGGTARDLIRDAYYHKNLILSDDIDIEVFGLTQEQLEKILAVELTGNNFPVYNTSYKDIEENWYSVQWALPRYERKVGKGHNGFEILVAPDMPTIDAAMRRELTINAIMINLKTRNIIDHFSGIYDLLAARLARVVSVATFSEDALRVLRAARFIARFNLLPSPDLIMCGQQMVEEYADLTPELREKELTKIFMGKNIFAALSFLDDVGWLKLIINNEQHYKNVVSNVFALYYEFDRVEISSFDDSVNVAYSTDREIVNWALLLCDRTQPEIIQFFNNLNPNWDKDTIKLVCSVVRHGNVVMEETDIDYISRYLKYNCKYVMGEVLAFASMFSGTDMKIAVERNFKLKLNAERFPIINGDDVLGFIPQGKQIGLILEFYKKQHIAGIITDRNTALKMLPNIVSLVERDITIC